MMIDPIRSAFRRVAASALFVCMVGVAAPSAAADTPPGTNGGPPAGAASTTVKAGEGLVDVVEFYNAGLDHYFVSADPAEIALLDNGAFGGAWKRTGYQFVAVDLAGSIFSTPGTPATAEAAPVCRFFGTDQYRADGSRIGPNSHFYTADPAECEYVKTAWPSVARDGRSYPAWTFETNAFVVAPPVAGACAMEGQPIYRAYNDGVNGDPNHRYATNPALLQAMTGWVFEGLVMCAPPRTIIYVSASRGDNTNSGARWWARRSPTSGSATCRSTAGWRSTRARISRVTHPLGSVCGMPRAS
jgi:hypothetical protein